MKKLILASASPRRKELLKVAGYDYEIVVSSADEIGEGSADEVVTENARLKASEVFSRVGNVVVGADTVVCIDNKILGKPENAENARAMLKSLSGRAHEVLTGFAIISEMGEDVGFCRTKVHFKALTDSEIDVYIATGEPFDKAGSYAIQEFGSLFVESIEGDYFNVIGLPIASLYPILTKHGITPKWTK